MSKKNELPCIALYFVGFEYNGDMSNRYVYHWKSAKQTVSIS